MRVALDISSLNSGHQYRGLGFYTQRLLQALSARFNLAEIVSFSGQPPNDVDLIHYPAFTLFTWPPRVTGIPTVVTVHDLIPLKYPKHFPLGIKARLLWRRQKHWLKQTQAIITDSQASKNDINRLTGINKEKIHVVYLAADDMFTTLNNQSKLNQVRNRYHLPDKFVLYVGDFNWNKNIPGLLTTCLKLKYPVVLVGKQAVATDYDHRHPENQSLVQSQQLADRHPDLIHRPGFIPGQDLVAIYNLAAVYSQISFAEGFGLPVLEAMACGCPVIAANAGSLPEITGIAAVTVNPGRAAELTSALKRLWQSASLRARYSRLGLSQAREFTWAKTAQATIKVYASLVKKA